MPSGRITHHLMCARELADDQVRKHIDRALMLIRKAHHRKNLR